MPPSTLDLRSHAENFLYNGKSVLRDLTTIFLILLREDFGKRTRFDLVTKWAKRAKAGLARRFPPRDPIALLVRKRVHYLVPVKSPER
jgi:hypothetical protein